MTVIHRACRLMLATVAATALGACALAPAGPNFQPEAVQAPAAFKAPGAAGPTALTAQWWTLFQDPQLDALELQALAQSPTLAAAAARTERARALLVAAGADAAPRLTADGSAQRFRSSSEVATAPVVAGRRVAIEDAQLSAQATVAWELDFWGRLKRQSEAAQAQLDAAVLEAQTARVLLSADVASTYLQLRGLDDEARVVRAAQDSRRDALRVVQSRYDAGVTTDLDLQRARTELANAQTDTLELARRRAAVENSLAVLTGQPASTVRLAAAQQALPVVPSVAAGLPSEVLRRRPDVAQAQALLHAASAQIGAAEAAFYPSIRLTGFGGLASADLGTLVSAPARLYGWGPTISLPILDGGRNQASLDAARAAHAEALANFRQRLLVALREVDDALAELQHRGDIAVSQQRAIDAASKLARVARTRYEQGASGYLEVTDAERSLLSAERAWMQTRAAQWGATVQLVKALGGGWVPS
jgi:multidrug efflux system outer membrane protein